MRLKEYILYKGEDIIALGTIKEIAKDTGLKENVVRYYGTPCYASRAKEGKRLILMDWPLF